MNAIFFVKYTSLDKQHHLWKDLVMSGKPIVSPLGREWSINIKRNDHGEIKIPWTTLSNYPVQGTGADIMMLARLSAKRRIEQAGIECKNSLEIFLMKCSWTFQKIYGNSFVTIGKLQWHVNQNMASTCLT